jgi:hypothetical protein
MPSSAKDRMTSKKDRTRVIRNFFICLFFLFLTRTCPEPDSG